jgi:hypothetical protein
MLPAAGFVNGLTFPTGADCAVLCIAEMTMPMGASAQACAVYVRFLLYL